MIAITISDVHPDPVGPDPPHNGHFTNNFYRLKLWYLGPKRNN
jgi:hypothetical protein